MGGRVLTNTTSLAYAIESSLGVLPGSPIWKLLEPNSYGNFGAQITTVPRAPITKTRQRRKGIVTDLNSPVDFEHDITLESSYDFIEGFCFSTFSSVLHLDRPTNNVAITSSGFTYTAITGSTVPQNSLVFARGWSTSTNNGLKVVTSGSTTSLVAVTGLTAETPSATQNATMDVCGFRGAVGDLQIDSSGNLISTVLDFTTLKLSVGQSIWIGGSLAANQFANAANTGFARVNVIATNKLTLSKRTGTFATDTGATKQVDILFGRFVKNVSIDDAKYLERSFQFELAYPNLSATPGATQYEYAKGNECNTLAFNLPLTNKATFNLGFVGTDTVTPSDTRATGASAPVVPVQTVGFGTSSDIARLRIQQVDETGLSTYFKSAKLTLNNNASPEKALANLGAVFINTGLFQADLEFELIFTDSGVVSAVRNNTTLGIDFALRNQDGGMLVDLPSLTLTGAQRSFPINQTVLVKATSLSFIDPTFGTSIGVTMFPFLP